MKKLFFIALLLLNLFVFGQNAESKNMVTFSTMKPIFSYAPRWHLGYIQRLDERFLIGVEVGYGNKSLTVSPAVKSVEAIAKLKNYQSFEIAPEVYFQLNPDSQGILMFASGEFFYLNHKQKMDRTEYFNVDDYNWYDVDAIDYHRQKYGFNLNFSTLFPIGDNWGIMPKVGGGIMLRNVKYTNPVNPVLDNSLKEAFFLDAYLPMTYAGKINDFSFRFDVKLVYRF